MESDADEAATPPLIRSSLTPSETRELLASLDLRPSRKLGQNFLIDGNIVRKSLELASVAAGDTVVEIGPGLGTLTRALLKAGARVYAVEKDPRLCGFLRENLAPRHPGRFVLLEDDAVRTPLAGLPTTDATPFKIVANLPYAISTPWLDAVLSGQRLPERMVLMLQQEAANRFSATPGGKEMGAITVFLRSAYDLDRGHRVPRRCFHPIPEVDSYLLNLRLKPAPYIFSNPAKDLIRRCFGQRRKQIGALLRRFASEHDVSKWLERLATEGFSNQTRPEAIPVPLWQELDRLIRVQETRP